MKYSYTPKSGNVIKNRFFLDKKPKNLGSKRVFVTIFIQAHFAVSLQYNSNFFAETIPLE